MSKVKMGAKYPRFAPITAEPEGKLPTCGAEKVTIGELIAAKLTVNLTSGREAFFATCKAAAILAEQGELARRALGYEPGPILDEETVRACAMPMESAKLRNEILRAVAEGYGREVESDEPVDLGLIELEQKKQKDDPSGISTHRVYLRVRGKRGHVDAAKQ